MLNTKVELVNAKIDSNKVIRKSTLAMKDDLFIRVIILTLPIFFHHFFMLKAMQTNKKSQMDLIWADNVTEMGCFKIQEDIPEKLEV